MAPPQIGAIRLGADSRGLLHPEEDQEGKPRQCGEDPPHVDGPAPGILAGQPRPEIKEPPAAKTAEQNGGHGEHLHPADRPRQTLRADELLENAALGRRKKRRLHREHKDERQRQPDVVQLQGEREGQQDADLQQQRYLQDPPLGEMIGEPAGDRRKQDERRDHQQRQQADHDTHVLRVQDARKLRQPGEHQLRGIVVQHDLGLRHQQADQRARRRWGGGHGKTETVGYDGDCPAVSSAEKGIISAQRFVAASRADRAP